MKWPATTFEALMQTWSMQEMQMTCVSGSVPNAPPPHAAAFDADHYLAAAAEATWPASQHLLQFFLFQRPVMPTLK